MSSSSPFHRAVPISITRSQQTFATRLMCLAGWVRILMILLLRSISSYESVSARLIHVFYQDFLPRLKDHLLAHLLGQDFHGDETLFTPQDRSTVFLINNRIYEHKVMRLNYTTYELRRAQDSLNSRIHAD